MNPVSDHVERILAVGDDLESLQHVFQAIIGEMGLSHFLYRERPHPIPVLNQGSPPFFLGRERGPLSQYIDASSLVGDPVALELVRRVTPFPVADAIRTHLSPVRRKRFMELLDDLGLASGLVIPLASRRGLHYSTTLFTAGRNGEASAALSRIGHDAHLLSTYFHQRVHEILDRQNSAARNLLTPRERECLLWAACGKTAWETSRILKIAERTVKFHLANASRRLDTSNTTHAVARAMLRGEFLP